MFCRVFWQNAVVLRFYKQFVGLVFLIYLDHWHVKQLQPTARVIFHLRSADHITDVLATLHWLRVAERIEYI